MLQDCLSVLLEYVTLFNVVAFYGIMLDFVYFVQKDLVRFGTKHHMFEQLYNVYVE